MALGLNDYNKKYRLQKGGHGEYFTADLPGYRDQAGEARINRSNNKMNASEHDVLNILYGFDKRLPELFRYGFAVGYNSMVIPKGRVVAADRYMNTYDSELQRDYNTLTLANGGVPVRVRREGDKYKAVTTGLQTGIVSQDKSGQAIGCIGKEYTPLIGQDAAYTDNYMRPFQEKTGLEQLKDAGYSIDPVTGKVMTADGVTTDDVRPGNKPLGFMMRNEYSRFEDAHNGMAPGPIGTDKLLELPWFAFKDKAENNPWGSAYGDLHPGDQVKSDENGRIVLSPLSDSEAVAAMTISEYEAERAQVVGEVYMTDRNLVPAGSAKWVQWALEDRLKFEGFNPDLYRRTNRDGEDNISNSPYNRTPSGYPYDDAFSQNDLHMLGSTGRADNYDRAMAEKYRYDRAIPGLTDGYNAVVRQMPDEKAGEFHYAGGKDYQTVLYGTLENNVDKGSLMIRLVAEDASADTGFVACTLDSLLLDGTFKISYVDEVQGKVRIEVADKAKADALLQPTHINVQFRYKKRGLAGVPTFLDWDGCIGSVKILFQK